MQDFRQDRMSVCWTCMRVQVQENVSLLGITLKEQRGKETDDRILKNNCTIENNIYIYIYMYIYIYIYYFFARQRPKTSGTFTIELLRLIKIFGNQ